MSSPVLAFLVLVSVFFLYQVKRLASKKRPQIKPFYVKWDVKR